MGYQKLQVQRAIGVIPQDGVPVPSPSGIKRSSSNTSVVVNQLVDAAANFISAGVLPGDVIYNTTTSTSTIVMTVVNATTIVVKDDIFLATPNAYSIYSPATGDGPVLYVGIGGDLNVVTDGGDTVLFENVQGGTFLPVMVKEVKSSFTTAQGIVALS